jgi:integration host factor subunit beta
MKPVTYTRKDIVIRASEKLDIPEINMKVIVDTILDTMTDMLTQPRSNIRIELRNFGIFEVKPTKAKPKARNPKTNEEIYVPPRRKIHFKAGKIIKQEIQKEWK